MSGAVAKGTRMVEAAADPDPATGLAAVAALRGLVEVLEELQVDNARRTTSMPAGFGEADDGEDGAGPIAGCLGGQTFGGE